MCPIRIEILHAHLRSSHPLEHLGHLKEICRSQVVKLVKIASVDIWTKSEFSSTSKTPESANLKIKGTCFGAHLTETLQDSAATFRFAYLCFEGMYI